MVDIVHFHLPWKFSSLYIPSKKNDRIRQFSTKVSVIEEGKSFITYIIDGQHFLS